MTSLQHSRPVRLVGWHCRRWCAHGRRRKPREPEYHRAGEAAEETPAGHLVGYVVREIGHVVLHFLHLRKRIECCLVVAAGLMSPSLGPPATAFVASNRSRPVNVVQPSIVIF